MAGRMGLVLDCADPDTLAVFWSAALGYTNVGSAGSYAMLLPTEGDGPQLLLQRVPEVKSAKNRMHLDIHVADIEAEAKRLAALGAQRLRAEVVEEHETHWFLMTDPEGNEFCICDGGASPD
ncbi:MAG TPA: VOC family protein [Acidimicrobiia bacterium]|nr:VOC family protein [Acidimicrobiia bacterium]